MRWHLPLRERQEHAIGNYCSKIVGELERFMFNESMNRSNALFFRIFIDVR